MLETYEARVADGALKPDVSQRAIVEKLDALADALTRWRPALGNIGGLLRGAAPRGLYIWGPVGGGKSLLMDLFFEAADVARKRRVHFHEFMRARHAFMRRARAETDAAQDELIVRAAKDVAKDARLLCFDEVHVTDIADAMILGRLFEKLFDLDTVIVATSNRAPDALYKNGLNRQLFTPFIALLKEKLDVVELAAARDYRLADLMAAPVYYAPLGPAATAAMDAAWRRLTQGAAPQPLNLDIEGRALLAPRCAAGVARFTFEDLCARPLGAADYIEIAEVFHTVLVEDVPRMDPRRRDEAARFRILVDVLYEAKTKLVMSAEAQPAGLYPEGDQSFEFERTVSRLMEMRTQAYLALPRRDAEWKRGIVE
ncbi:MAG: cell division protein ZapE [Alphaproteobacteria bacterium]|nr:cell division protein ZapE [Alphaproteobacteria bacterium]